MGLPKLKFSFKRKINKEQAKKIALEEIIKRGGFYQEPVHVSWGWGKYRIMTNAMSKGGNIYVKVSSSDGSIISFEVASR